MSKEQPVLVLGDIVLTEDGYGQVVLVAQQGVTVWVFGEGVMTFDRAALKRFSSPAAAHFGVGLVERQAAELRSLRKDAAQSEKRLHQARMTLIALETENAQLRAALRGAPVMMTNDDDTQGDE